MQQNKIFYGNEIIQLDINDIVQSSKKKNIYYIQELNKNALLIHGGKNARSV